MIYTDIIPGDYNGDGKTDFIRQEKGTWDNDNKNTAQVYLADPNSDGTFTKKDLTDSIDMKGDFTNIIPGDYNGDGKTDFIRQEKGSWDNDDDNTAHVYLANPGGDGTFTKIPLTDDATMKGDLTNIIPGDYNGDGKTDFIRQEKGSWDDDDSNTAQVYLANPNGDGTFTKIPLTDDATMKGDLTNIIPGDYNGDGKTDFIRQEKGSWGDDDSNTAQVYLANPNGDGTFTKIPLTDDTTMNGNFTTIIPADYDGDGKTDFIRQEKGSLDDDDIDTAHIYLANGDGTFTKMPLTDDTTMKGDLTNIIPGDYNGDGKTDFIRQEKGSLDDDDVNTAQVYLAK